MTTTKTTPAEESPLTVLAPRTAPDIKRLLEEMKNALVRSGQQDFLTRMERNSWFRQCYWEGQTWTGRKDCPEGRDPRKIFPWEGACDSRVPLIDEIINERADQLMVAYDMGRTRVGPRDLSPDADKQNRAALWGGVSDYYEDECADQRRLAVNQWVDWAEEFGHAILHLGWQEELQLEKREISAEDLLRITTQAALETAEMMAAGEAEELGHEMPAAGVFLSEEQQKDVAAAVEANLSEQITDPDLEKELRMLLKQYDPDMPDSEARRVIKDLRKGEPSEYYAPYVHRSQPEWRALMPMIDVFYPPEVRTMEQAPWVAMPEWVTSVQLEERVAKGEYNKAWVEQVLAGQKGRAWDFANTMGLNNHAWLTAGGTIGTGVAPMGEAESALYQIIHLYYRATCLGGVPAVYHTVLHPGVDERAGLHECCEHAHGRLPFRERVREPQAKTLTASRGVGEVSFTAQQEVKIQRDARADHASLQLMPPAEVPPRQAGGRVDLRPGRQIPRITTGGQGGINWLKPPGDPRGSKEVETDVLASLNAYWGRGADVEPEVKLTRLRKRVKDFLGDVREACKMTFQLIQQYSPEEIRAACVAGLPVDLQATRADIQGSISLDVSYDPADLDMDMVLKKLQILNEGLLPLDRTGSLNTHNILRAAVSSLMPSWTREVMPNTPEQTLRSEMEDEDRILTQLLAGQEQPYVPGKDHKARKQVLMQRINATNTDGTPTKIQRTMQQEPDIAALIENRIKFHDFQLSQQQNASVGRLGVTAEQGAPQGA